MYFSPLVKQELARIIPSNENEQKSELYAFIIMNGRVCQKRMLTIALDSPSMIKVVYILLKKIFLYEAKIEIDKINYRKKRYSIIISDKNKVKHILNTFKLEHDYHGKLIHSTLKGAERKQNIKDYSNKSFLRGAFLAGGFVNDPERMYHLEISCPSKVIARMIENVLHNFLFSAKMSFWQKKWTVYLKKSEEIFEFLGFIGVQRALLNFQDIIVRKDILNTVNRLVNCETANLDKTVASASRQLFYIDILAGEIGLDKLPPSIKDVARARMDHPYASIQELAEILGGGITKSGVFHRLKKIEEIANNYMSISES